MITNEIIKKRIAELQSGDEYLGVVYATDGYFIAYDECGGQYDLYHYRDNYIATFQNWIDINNELHNRICNAKKEIK